MNRLPRRYRIFRALCVVPVLITGLAFAGGLPSGGPDFCVALSVLFGVCVMPAMLRRGGYEVR